MKLNARRHTASNPRGAEAERIDHGGHGRTGRLVRQLPDGSVMVVPHDGMKRYVQRMLVDLFQRRHDALRLVSIDEGVTAIIGLAHGVAVGVDHAAFWPGRVPFALKQEWRDHLRVRRSLGAPVICDDLG